MLSIDLLGESAGGKSFMESHSCTSFRKRKEKKVNMYRKGASEGIGKGRKQEAGGVMHPIERLRIQAMFLRIERMKKKKKKLAHRT